jgi:hypothetical protein
MGGNLSKALGSFVAVLRPKRTRLTNELIGKLFGNKEMRLLMLGLDAAGKTSQFSAPNFLESVDI